MPIACFDCGGVLQFCRSSAERGFWGENEVMIDKQTGNAMPFFMAVDQGLLTLARPVRLSLETGQPLEAGDGGCRRHLNGPCRYPGCPNLCDTGVYCEVHRPENAHDVLRGQRCLPRL